MPARSTEPTLTATSIVLLAAALAACGGSHAAENLRAKARIFASAEDLPPPAPPVAIDVATLGGSLDAQDALLEQTETDVAARVGSFRLTGKLNLRFEGAGQRLELNEQRLAEQAQNGDLHLRLLDSDGEGMEILWVGGQAYGRSRYGPFVSRDRQSGLGDQREEVFGALRTLYLLSDRGWQLRGRGPGPGGCSRFEVSRGGSRPVEGPARFPGRLDSETAKRMQFAYGRSLTEARGELCVDSVGVVSQAQLALSWRALGDAGAADVHVDLVQTLADLGHPVAIAPPEKPLPEPHRPRGPFATLNRFGFIQKPDAGQTP